MKIGYFITLYPYENSFKDSSISNMYPVGGAEVVAYNLANTVAKLGFEVNIFSSSIDSQNHIEELDNMKIIRYGTTFKLEKAFFSTGLFTKAVEYDVDIVHLHFTTPPGSFAAYRYAIMKNKPLVITYHGDAVEKYGTAMRRYGIKLYNRFAVNRILSKAKLIISPSQFYIGESGYLPAYREKVITIPNGINMEEMDVPYSKEECRRRLSLSSDDKVVLFVGALIGYKSPDLLLKALNLVIKKIPNTKLVLIGDGPMRAQMETLANTESLADIVRFTGIVVGEQKALYFKAADIFVLPSTMNTEVFPIVLLEASLAGLPMVVSSLNTFRCIVEDGYNGVITEAGNVNSLADAIISLFSQPTLMNRMGFNARKRVEDYSWQNIARVMANTYDKVISNK